MALVPVSANNQVSAPSSAEAGTLDTQGQFTFGGINTTGMGGTSTPTSSATATQAAGGPSTIAILVVGAAIVGIIILLFHK
jgi:hypothetical protein